MDTPDARPQYTKQLTDSRGMIGITIIDEFIDVAPASPCERIRSIWIHCMHVYSSKLHVLLSSAWFA